MANKSNLLLRIIRWFLFVHPLELFFLLRALWGDHDPLCTETHTHNHRYTSTNTFMVPPQNNQHHQKFCDTSCSACCAYFHLKKNRRDRPKIIVVLSRIAPPTSLTTKWWNCQGSFCDNNRASNSGSPLYRNIRIVIQGESVMCECDDPLCLKSYEIKNKASS